MLTNERMTDRLLICAVLAFVAFVAPVTTMARLPMAYAAADKARTTIGIVFTSPEEAYDQGFGAVRAGRPEGEIPIAIREAVAALEARGTVAVADVSNSLAAVGSLKESSLHALVLHEILVRVMTELTIDDGPQQADLGENFRTMVTLLLDRHIAPVMAGRPERSHSAAENSAPNP